MVSFRLVVWYLLPLLYVTVRGVAVAARFSFRVKPVVFVVALFLVHAFGCQLVSGALTICRFMHASRSVLVDFGVYVHFWFAFNNAQADTCTYVRVPRFRFGSLSYIGVYGCAVRGCAAGKMISVRIAVHLILLLLLLRTVSWW